MEVKGDGIDNDCDPNTQDSPIWSAAQAEAGVVQGGDVGSNMTLEVTNILWSLLAPLCLVFFWRNKFKSGSLKR